MMIMKKKKSEKNLWIIFPSYKRIQQNWFQSSREIKMYLRLRESSVLSQYCDFCPNHPRQPFPLVVFCVVFFSNKLNKHNHPNSRSGGIFKGRSAIDEQTRPSNSDPV